MIKNTPSNFGLEANQLVSVLKMEPAIKQPESVKKDNCHELIFLTGGAGVHTIDYEVYEIYPPVGFYLRPGQHNRWEFVKIPQGFTILFREDIISGYPFNINNLNHLESRFDINRDPSISELAAKFYQDYRLKYPEDILASYLHLILLKTMKIT